MTDPRIRRPLDPAAVRAANEKLWADHPELGGRQLTMAPDDAAYREAWIAAYAEASGGPAAAPPSPELGAVVAPCPAATTYGSAIRLDGDEEFRRKTIAALDEIKGTPSGAALLQSIEDSGKSVTIRETNGGNSENATSFADGLLKQDGTKGTGSDSVVDFNPDRSVIGDGSEPWMNRPASVGLAHELIHSAHDANGTTEFDYSDADKQPQNYELQTVGLAGTKDGAAVDYSGNAFTENKIRADLGQPARPEY